MTYELYRLVFLLALIACGVMAVVSAILFFTLKIPRVIGDLTGHTARKAIEDIRKQNEQTGDKSHRSSAVNRQRGKITSKISQSGNLMKHPESPFGTGVTTEQLAERKNIRYCEETTVLEPAQETTVLYSENGGMTAQDLPETDPAPYFGIEYEITFLHTNEVIE